MDRPIEGTIIGKLLIELNGRVHLAFDKSIFPLPDHTRHELVRSLRGGIAWLERGNFSDAVEMLSVELSEDEGAIAVAGEGEGIPTGEPLPEAKVL